MPGYFDASPEETRIITKEDVLLPDHVPEKIEARDAELGAIAAALKPLTRKRLADNLFIYGPPGTGKTSCIRFLLNELSEETKTVLPVYVNCWEDSTQLAVYNRIVEAMKLPLPRRGLAADELFDKILSYMRAYNTPVLLVLDEMDGLRGDELLYVISRAIAKPGIIFGIVGITNNKGLLARLDPRVRSSLRFSSMEFKPYSEDQLADILKARAERALVEGGWDERVLRKIAKSVDNGNARDALELLWKSAKRAEAAGRSKIMLQDVADSENSGERPFRFAELKLSDEEMKVVGALEGGERDSSALYPELESLGRTKRQIRNYLDLLERKGVVESREGTRNGMLTSRVYKLSE